MTLVELEPASQAAPDPREALAAWYLRRRHRAVWLLPLTVTLVCFIGLLLLRGLAGDPQTNLKASRAALLAVTPPDVPKGENAADDYALAKTAMVLYVPPANVTSDEPDPHNDPSVEGKHFERPEVRTYIAGNAAALQHLYNAASRARCNWGVDLSLGYALPNYVHQQRQIVELLSVHARVAAHAGDHQAALKSCAALYKLAQHVNTPALLYCGEGTTGYAKSADDIVQAIITWDTPATPSDLAAYRKAVWQDRDPQALATGALACEKAVGLYTVDAVAAGALSAIGVTAHQLSRIAPGKGGSLLYGSERQCLGATIDDLSASILRGEWLTKEQTMGLVARHQTGPASLAFAAMSAYASNLGDFARCGERARTIDAGLAFLQFRARHGRDPKSLDEIVPEFLAAVPKGVFHAVPLRMRVDPKGVLRLKTELRAVQRANRSPEMESWHDPGTIRIYTLGENGKDDDGYPKYGDDGKDYSKGDSENQMDDTVFRVPPMKRSDAVEKAP